MAAIETVSRITLRPHDRQSLFDVRSIRLPRERPPLDEYDPIQYREPKAPIKLWMAYFNFLRSLFGAGVLGIPLAISQAGIILGPIIAICIALLIIHMQLTLSLSLDKALKDPTVLTKRYGVITIGIFVPAVLSIIFGIFGYWSFGAMEENILRSLPFDDELALLAIGLYLISIAFAYPIQCYPATQLIVEVIKNYDVDFTPSDETLKTIEAFARPVFVLASFLMCYIVPYQAAVVSFMGNFCTSLMVLVFPATMELCLLYPKDYGRYNVYLIKDVIIIVLGLLAWLKNLPLWTWDCVNEKCVPTKTKLTENAISLTTCNMLCASMHLWPLPTGPVSLSTTAAPVRSDLFQLQIVAFPSPPVHDLIRDTFDIFREDLHKMEKEVFGFEEWRSVLVRITINKNGSGDPRMLLNTDESYILSVHPMGNSITVDINANSFCGARHGLETLLQLVWFDTYVGCLFMMEAASVVDAPRFRYRGLLLDTARNYFPVNELLRTIDGMAACKLNTFHWHATEFQAFPLLLSSVPQLAQYGAYSSEAVYTTNDVRLVVQRARLRGIRVLLEVDVPSHVGSAWDWQSHQGFGKLIHCDDKQPWNAYCADPPCGELNPRNSHVFTILESVYREILQLTGVDDIFHMGGDYISSKCCLEQFNSSDPAEIWLEFTRKALRRLEIANGKLPELTLLWSSHLSERIKLDLKAYVSNIGLQVRSVGWAHKYITGVRTVISHEDAWDLNSGFGAWQEVSDGAPYNSWQRVYEYRPWARGTGCIQGGEAIVWSSTLSSGGLDSRVWPRAAAIAERLWSDRPEGATRPVHARLDIQRSRLVSRGIRASPLWSMWCTHNPYTCD
ncbi:probable beta-hexosaminidase fdl [Epargyreus clarus]|uniref:probable beta-hexosaminidase fdl n=1 Tax=Epargyreus clarus TaxID=520877 RepID=UPI003C301C8F